MVQESGTSLVQYIWIEDISLIHCLCHIITIAEKVQDNTSCISHIFETIWGMNKKVPA